MNRYQYFTFQISSLNVLPGCRDLTDDERKAVSAKLQACLDESMRHTLLFANQGEDYGAIESKDSQRSAGLGVRGAAPFIPDSRQEPRSRGAGSDWSRITGRKA